MVQLLGFLGTDVRRYYPASAQRTKVRVFLDVQTSPIHPARTEVLPRIHGGGGNVIRQGQSRWQCNAVVVVVAEEGREGKEGREGREGREGICY